MPKQISVISSVEDTYKEEFVANQLVEVQINPSLSLKMRHDHIHVLYTYKNAFASDDEPLGSIEGNEVVLLLILTDHTLHYLEDQLIQPIPELEKPWKDISKS
ncbi:hypothetical protein O181_016294 [Austropuccinia psidii MF-1]|uniref:Uncharacterized protein n=1 Tax=Austropuccinia psidii MF-1 TaxID=1389203 RepID=A0A9Q3C1F2_9BASI|nr:hypothetical protein [Austropuccinia psidii MF-1]